MLPWKLLPSLAFSLRRIVVPAGVEEVGGDDGHCAAVEPEWSGKWPLVGMDHADDHGREPGHFLRRVAS